MRLRHLDFLRSFFRGLFRMWHEITAASFVLLVILFLASGAVYYFEQPAQPDVFRTFWHALYWGVITITTVGYGDIAPVTWQGRLIGALFSLLGVGFLLLIVSTFAAAYVQEANQADMPGVCPHCGEKIEADDEEDTGVLS